jgi:hypothetical protein
MSLASRLAKLAVRALEGAGEREAAPVVRKIVAARPLALPAPPKVLALPAPKPKSLAVKPRGGQFYPDVPLAARDARAAGFKVRDRGARADPGMRYQVVLPAGGGTSAHGSRPEAAWRLAEQRHAMDAARKNLSPEAAARRARVDAGIVDRTPDLSDNATPLGGWLERALAKYYKTDFGTEADPLRDLAARGLHYDPEMTPERWLDTVNSSIHEDPIGYFTVPRHAGEIKAEHNPPQFSNDFAGDVADTAHHLIPGASYYGNADPVAQGALMQAAPWLRKQPATDMLYGIRPQMDLGHFADEMLNAMSGQLPSDLAVRPESLQRMSFPQAVEHVGKINQFRVKQMEAEQANMLNNPALQLFKEYPDDPRGLRWTELRAPEGTVAPNRAALAERSDDWLDPGYVALRDALRNEGDVMGHCVGGYCDDVVSGRSRIFSLRDAKGMPHVTIETAPNTKSLSDFADEDPDLADAWNRHRYGTNTPDRDMPFEEWLPLHAPDLHAKYAGPQPEDIIQIKGKQNRAPNPEYLPFVQDFVKSGKWGEIGDLGNTGLERLPDQRFITQAQLEEGINKFYEQGGRRSPYYNQPENWVPEDWEQLKPHFGGYARGGLVVKKCGCAQCNGFAVRKTTG